MRVCFTRNYAATLLHSLNQRKPMKRKKKPERTGNKIMNTYQITKQQLKNGADLIKSTTDDKPAIRTYINNLADSIIKDTINCPSLGISEAKREQYRYWLSLYACKLHP